MKKAHRLPSTRRNFLQRFTAGSLALFAGAVPSVRAASASEKKSQLDDAWLDLLHGTHRQVFDLVEPNGGMGAAYAVNFLESFKEVHKVSDEDVCAVAVFRHRAFPLALNDKMWEKYKIGEFLKVNDPKTEAPAVRNIFHDNIPLRPGLTYEKLIAERGVVMVACNLALTVISGFAAPNAGVSAEEAAAEWTQNLLEGVLLVPSGVYAVNRAQENGCSYCYGG